MPAPRKYSDPDRTQVTDEWLEWRELQADLERESLPYRIPGYRDDVYFPEDHDKDLGEDGAWIFVVDPPNGSVALDFEVPVLSMWFARPTRLNGAAALAGRLPYQAVIQTPAGDLHLWPYEYKICNQPENFLGLEGVELHSLGGDPVLDEMQLWYLMSRGISQEEATWLLFSQIKAQNYCYLTFPDYAIEMFGGLAVSLQSHIARNPR